MKVNIKLDNSKFCNGCLLATKTEALDQRSEEGGQRFLAENICQLGYWVEKKSNGYMCQYKKNLFTYINEETNKACDFEKNPYMIGIKTLINRPIECMKDNGNI